MVPQLFLSDITFACSTYQSSFLPATCTSLSAGCTCKKKMGDMLRIVVNFGLSRVFRL